VEVPRFEVSDIKGYEYLEENGYVVFKGVANEEEIETGKRLAWDYLEELGVGIDRNNLQSWNTSSWPDPFGKGIITGDGVGQCALLWFARSIPAVKQIYSNIWNAQNLITSFDGFCIHRPFEYNASWKTKSEVWYHLDQNGHHKPGKLCIQGFLNFYPSGPDDGGLVLIPKSHTIFNKIFRDRPFLKKRDDFIVLSSDNQLWTKDLPYHGLSPIKVCCQPGDFVLWDSRTIHSNCSAKTARDLPANPQEILPPRRLVTYVCMTPASRLTPEITQKRIQCYLTGQTTSHWPEEANTPSVRKNRANYQPVDLTPQQKELIPLQ